MIFFVSLLSVVLIYLIGVRLWYYPMKWYIRTHTHAGWYYNREYQRQQVIRENAEVAALLWPIGAPVLLVMLVLVGLTALCDWIADIILPERN